MHWWRSAARTSTHASRRAGRRLRSRSGFSLIETLTAVAITGVIAGVIVARTVSPRGSGDVVAIVQTLNGVAEAVTAYRGTVGRYPARIDDLVNQPEATRDLCGRSMPAHFLEEWRGPYMVRRIESEGIPMGEAILRSAIRREPQTSVGSSLGTLLIDVTDVQRDIAERVNTAFDNDSDDLSSGTIRWTPSPESDQLGTLVFGMPVRGC